MLKRGSSTNELPFIATRYEELEKNEADDLPGAEQERPA